MAEFALEFLADEGYDFGFFFCLGLLLVLDPLFETVDVDEFHGSATVAGSDHDIFWLCGLI